MEEYIGNSCQKQTESYYYNASNPWGTETPGFWKAAAELPHHSLTEPLAACQNPEMVWKSSDRTFRHGIRQKREGSNNTLFPSGAVKIRVDPKTWQ